MASFGYRRRVQARWARSVARFLFKCPFRIDTSVPLISFTFDDFPRSALHAGGRILNRYGLAGTYYASLGMMGKQEPSGTIFVAEDLKVLFEQGHELGCHTFAHYDSWKTEPRVFEDSIVENQRALSKLYPDKCFKTFAYPISPPRARTKLKMMSRFMCCRGGGQAFNVGTMDLNYVSAYFLEKTKGNIEAVRDVIDRNRRAKGWLVFATHDISDAPTPFGCTPSFFEEVVKSAVSSGACILPVVKVLEQLGASKLSA